MIELADIQAAHKRIQPYIRHTPLIPANPVKQKLDGVESLYFKLECLQIGGSFKARGAVNKLLSLPEEQVQRGLVTASGGNHAMGVSYAGWLAKTPVTIYLPQGTPQSKAQKIAAWGSKVIYEGTVWDEANLAALEHAERDGLTYFHPFADPVVIAGQGTVGLELLDSLPEVDTLVVAIGGGGLISGISLAAKALKPEIRIIGVEAVGSPTLYESIRANQLITLSEVTTVVGTMAARRSEQINLDIIRQHVEDIVLITDDDMREAARWLWFEMGLAAEMSGAAALAAILTGKIPTQGTICALVCGAGTDGIPA